jgi:hypothetical protein
VKRPAYGGTCYSNFDVGTTATVTAYDQTGLIQLVEWVASTSDAQAYAHPMDGFAAVHPSLGCPAPLSPATVPSVPHGKHLSRGTIAGIVSGASSVLIAVVVLVWLALRSYRKRHRQASSYQPTIFHIDHEQAKIEMRKMAAKLARNESHGTLEVQENPVLEKEAPERFEIGCKSARSSALYQQASDVRSPAELDAEYIAELEGEDIKKDVKYTYSPI